MRRLPPPDRVTRPPPSRTTWWLVFTTFAVRCIAITTGFGPQSNVVTPPFATARTTFCDVQLAGVPSPMTWSGWDVFAARARAGTGTVFTSRSLVRSAVGDEEVPAYDEAAGPAGAASVVRAMRTT